MQNYKELIFALGEMDSSTGLNYINGCDDKYNLDSDGSIKVNLPKVISDHQLNHWYKTDKFILNQILIKPFARHGATYKTLSEINEDQKYFYMINFHLVDFIQQNKNIGFSHIPHKVLTDVKNHKAKIVLHCSTEAYSGSDYIDGNGYYADDFDIVQKWIDNAGLPPCNVYYITGNLASDKTKTDNIKYHIVPLSVFDGWVAESNIIDLNQCSIVKFNPQDEKYLYLNFTREPRAHRVYFLASLVANKILNDGKNSFNMLYAKEYNKQWCYRVITDERYKLTPSLEIIEGAKEIDKIGYRYIDINNSDMKSSVKIVTPSLYEQTFISIITETTTASGTIFITEKTFKSIALGHPFMILGCKGLLKQLKELGYKTFDKWIDESYDDCDTVQEKVEIICNNLLRLKEKSLEELIQIRNEMLETCEYNQKYFVSQIKDRYFVDNIFIKEKPVLDIIKNIKDNW